MTEGRYFHSQIKDSKNGDDISVIAMAVLSSAVKIQITKNWLSEFPLMARYKPLYLMRRVEPLVIGLYLELGRLSEDYRPTFHVFNLANPYSFMIASLKEQLHYEGTSVHEYIEINCPEEKWRDAARRLKVQVPLLSMDNVDLTIIVDAFRKSTQSNHQIRDFEDVISLMSWCGRTDLSVSFLNEAVAEISKWRRGILENLVMHQGFDLSRWSAAQLLIAENPSIPREQVTKSIQQFKLEKIPVSPFGCS